MDSPPPLPDDAPEDVASRKTGRSRTKRSKSKPKMHRSKSGKDKSFRTTTTIDNGEHPSVVVFVHVYRLASRVGRHIHTCLFAFMWF